MSEKRYAAGPVRILAIPCALAVWMALAPIPAGAQSRTHHDPDDARSSLDLRSVHLWSFPQPGLYSLVVRTYDDIDLDESPTFVGWIDALGDRRWDYVVVLRRHGCTLFFRVGVDPGDSGVLAARMEPRKVHCLFQLNDPFDETRPTRLRVWARRNRDLTALRGLVDRAPDVGWFAD
jgi:hypothetical protein